MAAMTPAARALLDLYLPLRARADLVIGQLGQSLDGRIATHSGHSHYINGPDDIRRLHRLRALVDAVIVGAGTVHADDPRLTVREVPGDNPVRVLLDPSGRLAPTSRVLSDGAAPTLWLRSARAAAAGTLRGVADPGLAPSVEIVLLDESPAGGFDPAAVVAALASRGLRRLLVEGGGITVSRFLQAGVLDRLHISVAPLLIGSGRPALTLPPIETLGEALRPPVRHFLLGDDLLFDLDLSRR
jgi:riboflavin-specific deaminase-like protein